MSMQNASWSHGRLCVQCTLDVEVQHDRGLFDAVWSSNGGRLVALKYANHDTDNVIDIWDTRSKQSVAVLRHTSSVHSIAWSPDASRIATGTSITGGGTHIWKLHSDGRAILGCTLQHNVHAATCGLLSWSPDGTHLALASYAKPQLLVFELSSRRIGCVAYDVHPRCIAWSHCGERIAVGVDKCLAIEHTSMAHRADTDFAPGLLSLQRDFEISVHSVLFTVHAVAWSPDDTRVCIADMRNTACITQIRKPRGDRNTVFLYIGHNERFNSISWSPDGKSVVVFSRMTHDLKDFLEGIPVCRFTRICDAATGACTLKIPASPFQAFSWSLDRRHVISRLAGVELGDTRLYMGLLFEWSDKTNHRFPLEVRRVIFRLMCIYQRISRNAVSAKENLPRLPVAVIVQIFQEVVGSMGAHGPT